MKKAVLFAAILGFLLSSCNRDKELVQNNSDEPMIQGVGLLGGVQDPLEPYAFVSDAQGNLDELSFSPNPTSFEIASVAIDVDGDRGILGGIGFTPGGGGLLYTVNLTEGTVANKVGGSIDPSDEFFSVAISENGRKGLAGGINILSPIAHVVDLATNSGSTLILPPTLAGSINSTAINTLGETGVIGGGSLFDSPFAFKVSDILTTPTLTNISPSVYPPPPTVTPVLPYLGGEVATVAINAESPSVMLYGGVISDSTPQSWGFASKVDEGETVTAITFPSSDPVEEILSVAMSRSGSVAILGGFSKVYGTPGARAYKLNMTESTATTITLNSGTFPEGIFRSVAIDSLGVTGLIGGAQVSGDEKPIAYAINVESGAATPVSFVTNSGAPLTEGGTVLSVEIQDQGEAGLLGGTVGPGPTPAAFLVTGMGSESPIALQLTLPGSTASGKINSVSFDNIVGCLNTIQTGTLFGNSLDFAKYLNQNANVAHFFCPATVEGKLNPALDSASPLRNSATLFSADNTFFSISQGISRRARDARQFRRLEEKEQKELAMLAKNGEDCFKITNYPKEIRLNNLWVEAIGLVAHQDRQDETPSFDPWSVGALLGYDMQKTKNFRAGLGLAYAYTYVDFNKENGNSNVNQEYLSLYGLWNRHNAYANLGLWFGLFQTNNERKIPLPGFDFRATSYTSGYQFDPHIEIGYDVPFKEGTCTFEPFGAVDWIHNWQDPYKEYSNSPFKFFQQNLHSSMLRVEAGFRVYEEFEFRVWNLILQQNISYLYKDTYSLGNWKGFLLGAPGTLVLDTLSESESLGSLSFSMIFDPKRPCYPTGRMGYKGEFGADYRSHQITASTEWSF